MYGVLGRKILQKRAKGILYPDAAFQHYTVSKHKPAEVFSEVIEEYWIVRWDLPSGKRYDAEMLPFPSVNAFIAPGRSWITGIVSGKYQYRFEGAGVLVRIKFRPGGFYAFYPEPQDQLVDAEMAVEKIFPAFDQMKVTQALQGTDETVIEEIEKLLSSVRLCFDYKVGLAIRVMEAIVANPELKSAEMVANHFHMSTRSLQELLRVYVGIGLKAAVKRYRLLEAIELVHANRLQFALIAAHLGYADQAHFANDFKKIIGKSPREYFRSALPGQA